MKNFLLLSAFFLCLLSASARAEVIGEACANEGAEIRTTKSQISSEGVIQCIPDMNGNFWWQAVGGVARYDTTTTCSVAGAIRWNGTAFQGCYGTEWKSFNASCHYNYYAREVRGDGNYWHNYGSAAGVLCINNVPDKTWEFIGFDECYEDGDKCTPDGQICYYAQQVCN